MKTKSPESSTSKMEEIVKSSDNYVLPGQEAQTKVEDGSETKEDAPRVTRAIKEKEDGTSKNSEHQINSDNDRSPATSMIQPPTEEISKDEIDSKDADGPGQILAWISETFKALAIESGTTEIKKLEEMISSFFGNVSNCISKCYVPNRAAKMKRHMAEVLLYFNFIYHEIAEELKVDSSYLDIMASLMAYYIDMEIQASSRAKENPALIASKITSSLYVYLDRSHNHILDSMLKANNMNKNFWELASLIFSGVLKECPGGIMDELTYVRYVLVYKMWKRVVQGAEERKKIVALASQRLKHPPQFVDKIRAGLLNGIIPKVPRKRADVTNFLIQAKFDVKEKAKAFLKYVLESKNNVMFVPPVPAVKVDIPLLVGYLPDFGPSPSFVLSQPVELNEERESPQKVDMSGSRLMNDIWTSVNHEVSFRESIRMQNVTTFSKVDLKMKEKKIMLRALKQRKGKMKPIPPSDESQSSGVPEENNAHEATSEPAIESSSCKPPIVINDDNEKGNGDVASERIIVTPEVALVDKRKECQVSVPVRPLQKSVPSPPSPPTPPPPPPESLPPSPIPEIIILDPSEIKQEDDCDDDVILVSAEDNLADNEVPSHSTQDLEPEMKTPTNETKDDSVSLNIHCQQGRAGLGTSKKQAHAVKENVLEVKNSDNGLSIKETEVNIRINRNLFSNIKASNSLEKEQISSEVVKPTEACSESTVVEIDDRDLPECVSTGTKTNSLFDDEESSWGPSGTSQEFFRNVVDNFISGESPGHDLEASEGCSIAATMLTPQNSMQTSEIEEPDGALIHNSLIPSAPVHTVHNIVDMGPPPAKKFCVGGSSSSNVITHEVEDTVYSKPYEPVHSVLVNNDQSKVVERDPEVVDEAPESIHYLTLRRDHAIFLSQAKFRETYVVMQNIPSGSSVPSPIQPNPDTGIPFDRCECVQCKGNFDALTANYNALLSFVIATASSRECPSQDLGSTSVVETQAKLDEECNDQADETMMDPNEAPVDLPFKKRKFIGGSDGKEREEESTIPVPVPPEPTVYPATPMLSIASLAENRTYVAPLNHEFHHSIPFQTTCSNAPSNGQMMIEHNSSHSDLSNHTSRSSLKSYPVAPSATKDFRSTAITKPLGGGFPPFSSVINPTSTSHLPADNVYSSSAITTIEEQKKRRTFRTPAQLKAMWEPGTRISPLGPATTSVQLADTNYNLPYNTRQANSVATHPEPKVTKKRKSSRRKKICDFPKITGISTGSRPTVPTFSHPFQAETEYGVVLPFNSISEDCSIPSVSSGQCSADSAICSDTENSTCNETDSDTLLNDKFSAAVHKVTVQNDASVYVWQSKMFQCSTLQFDQKASKIATKTKWDRCSCEKCRENFRTLIKNEQNLLYLRVSAALKKNDLSTSIDDELFTDKGAANVDTSYLTFNLEHDLNLSKSSSGLKAKPLSQMEILNHEQSLYDPSNDVDLSPKASPHSSENSDSFAHQIERECGGNLVSKSDIDVFDDEVNKYFSKPSSSNTVIHDPSKIVLNVDLLNANVDSPQDARLSPIKMIYHKSKEDNGDLQLPTTLDNSIQSTEICSKVHYQHLKLTTLQLPITYSHPDNCRTESELLSVSELSPINDPSSAIGIIDDQINREEDYNICYPTKQDNDNVEERSSAQKALSKPEVPTFISQPDNRTTLNMSEAQVKELDQAPISLRCSKLASTRENLSANTISGLLEIEPTATKEKETDVDRSSLHVSTLMRDHSVFIIQTTFREICVASVNNSSFTSSSLPTLPNPLTENSYNRCQCEQCKGNLDAIISNYHSLVGYAQNFLSVDLNCSTVSEKEQKLEESINQIDERMMDLTDADVDLPFKKRKFIALSDEQKTKETLMETANEATVYPSTPMLSIACLAETNMLVTTHDDEFHKSIEYGAGSINEQTIIDYKSSHCSSSYTSRVSRICCPVAPFTKKDNVNPAYPSKHPYGGFPPVCSVITPVPTSHLQTDEACLPSTISTIEDNKRPQMFRTPAQLKAMWEPETQIAAPGTDINSAQLADFDCALPRYDRPANCISRHWEIKLSRKRMRSSRKRK